jgi:hypothetical protein
MREGDSWGGEGARPRVGAGEHFTWWRPPVRRTIVHGQRAMWCIPPVVRTIPYALRSYVRCARMDEQSCMASDRCISAVRSSAPGLAEFRVLACQTVVVAGLPDEDSTDHMLI